MHAILFIASIAAIAFVRVNGFDASLRAVLSWLRWAVVLVLVVIGWQFLPG